MDPKALRAQREKDLRGLVTLAVLDGDEDKLVTRLLDSLEDIDGAFTFFAQRKRGPIACFTASAWQTTRRSRLSRRLVS